MKKTQQTLATIESNWTQWIAKNIEFEILSNNDIQVLTSFTDYFDDSISFNILETGSNSFTLTDKGYTFWNMSMNGIDLGKNYTTRHELFKWYLKSFDFKLGSDNSIKKENVKIKDLSQSINDFIQLLLRVSDLSATNRANTRGVFYNDVKIFFDNNDSNYIFTKQNIVEGISKQQYRFEYNFTPKLGINKMTKLYNTLSKNTMEAIIGIYSDAQQFLEDNYGSNSLYILVNDTDDKTTSYIEGLEQHNIKVVNFQNKNSVAKEFKIAA